MRECGDHTLTSWTFGILSLNATGSGPANLSRGPGIPQFGLVVEQVEKVNPDLVVRDEQGKPYTVRYEAVNAMLLNEFLKEHRKVEELEKGMAVLTAQLKEQAAQIQKVSAQIEASKPAAQVVNNP